MENDKYIGRLLDNRYEILEVIGTGGMAVVYKARCHRLNRLVAVKILKDDNLEDEDFRRRFHAESQAVAMLSHPNIVSVYDVSTSIMADYIVMELIEGITLKQYMEKKGILNWKETLHFAMQIAKALEHAHSKGIVHRDIKPHNIMVLKNGSVKVMDFGIARLISRGNTLTKEALGSVHYISPEQAKGGRVDDRSDIYSLGVVMYEMMAGRPPYDGESPVSVAIQHINGGATLPSLLNPNIPGGLEQIIMKAMAHNVADRYPSATRMLSDMDEFRKDPTILFDYNTPPLDAVTQLQKPPLVLQPPATTAEKVVENQTNRTEPSVRALQNQRRQEADRRRKQQMDEKRSRVTTIAIISCSLVIVIAIVVLLVIFLGGGMGPKDETIEVPELIGQVYAELPEYPGLTIMKEEEYNDTVEAGVIMDQSPLGGVHVEKDSKVVVFVSLGEEPPEITMENLLNTEQSGAEALLNNLNLNLDIKVEKEHHNEIKKGNVIRTEPEEGTLLQEGQTVTLFVSLGKEIKESTMPNVVDEDQQVAISILELQQLDLDIKVEEVFDANIKAGYVVKTEPEKGEKIKTGDAVTLFISKGAEFEEAVMPNLVNEKEATAINILELQRLDLKIKVEDVFDNDVEAGYVVKTEPAQDEMLKTGDTVKLYISKGAETKVMPGVVGMDVGNATKVITAAGFKTPEFKYVTSDKPKDTVVAQSHEKNTECPVNEQIVLEISSGPQNTQPQEVTRDVVIDLRNSASNADCSVEIKRDGKTVHSGTATKGTASVTLKNQTGLGTVTYEVIINGQDGWNVTEVFSANG